MNFEHLMGEVVSHKNGWDYHCVHVINNLAIIIVRNGNTRVCYELWKLRPTGKASGHSNKYGVRFPSDSQWGRIGWTYKNELDVYKKLLSLLESDNIKKSK